MIDLTPLDVRKKKDDFKRAVRGYDSLQVDAFLDVVADRLEQLVRQHGSLTEKVEHLESSLHTYQERERALNEALLAAQELREEARSQAERDAAVRLREAETHAEAILLDADQAIRHSQRRLEDLRARRRQFLKSLRGMLERFDDYLELEDTRLEGEAEDLGNLLERLQTDLGGEARGGSRDERATESPPGASTAASPGVSSGARSSGHAAEGDRGPDHAPAPEAPGSLNGDTGPSDEADGSHDEVTPGTGTAGERTPPATQSPTPIVPSDADRPGDTSS